MSHDLIDALFEDAHNPDFYSCSPCQAALTELKDGPAPLFWGSTWDQHIKKLHERNLRHDALVRALLKPSPAFAGGVVTYYIEGPNPMTQPSLPMTAEAAEIALTRELGFRLVGTTLESVSFSEEDLATVKDAGTADLPMQKLWSAAVAAYVALGNAEQRERELLVKLRTILADLDSDKHVSSTCDEAADELRALLDGE